MNEAMKQCTRCKREFPATTEYFHADRSKSDGLYSRCRFCRLVPPKIREPKVVLSPEDESTKPTMTAEEKLEAEKARQRELRLLWEQEHPQEYQALLARKREAQRERRRKNPQRYIDYQDQWRKKHPERAREIGRLSRAKRRARELNAEGEFTQADLDAQYNSQKGKCWWCATQLNGKYQVDHINPLSRGGSNWPQNIVLSCESCNKSRGGKLPYEWGDRLL